MLIDRLLVSNLLRCAGGPLLMLVHILAVFSIIPQFNLMSFWVLFHLYHSHPLRIHHLFAVIYVVLEILLTLLMRVTSI